VVVRIFEDYTAGLSPIAITRQLNAESVPSPRSGKTSGKMLGKPAAWTPNTLTGNAARGTGIVYNSLYVDRRPYGKQMYRKNPDTVKRHAFNKPEEKRAGVVEAPELRIVSVDLWERVRARQASSARSPKFQAAAPTPP